MMNADVLVNAELHWNYPGFCMILPIFWGKVKIFRTRGRKKVIMWFAYRTACKPESDSHPRVLPIPHHREALARSSLTWTALLGAIDPEVGQSKLIDTSIPTPSNSRFANGRKSRAGRIPPSTVTSPVVQTRRDGRKKQWKEKHKKGATIVS